VARIVIVDDNLLCRSLLTEIINDGGHEVVGEAKDGLEAPGRVRDLRPDLVTLDLVMPGRGGLQTLRHLMLLDHSLPVVVCSAFLNENHVLQALRYGAKGFIVKPFDRESVLGAIESTLANTCARRAAQVLTRPADDGPEGRREFVRADAELRVILESEDRPECFVDTLTVNLSGSGMLLGGGVVRAAGHVGLRLYLGTHVGFRLYLGEREPPIDGRARVVRITEEDHLALAFEHVTVTDHERLIGYVTDHGLSALSFSR
jgi:two-component system chemotaxis response regulator CheY